MVSPALTLAHTGSFAQATTSLSSSLAINELSGPLTAAIIAKQLIKKKDK